MDLSALNAGQVLRPDLLLGTPKVPSGGRNEKAAKEMEALFITQLLKAMRKTVPDSGALSGGRGGELARSMQDESIGKSMAARGGFGLAEQLLANMNRVDPGGMSDNEVQNSEPKGTD